MMATTGLTFFTPLTDSPAQCGIALRVPVVSLVMVKDSRGFTGTISPVEMSFLYPTMSKALSSGNSEAVTLYNSVHVSND